MWLVRRVDQPPPGCHVISRLRARTSLVRSTVVSGQLECTSKRIITEWLHCGWALWTISADTASDHRVLEKFSLFDEIISSPTVQKPMVCHLRMCSDICCSNFRFVFEMHVTAATCELVTERQSLTASDVHACRGPISECATEVENTTESVRFTADLIL